MCCAIGDMCLLQLLRGGWYRAVRFEALFISVHCRPEAFDGLAEVGAEVLQAFGTEHQYHHGSALCHRGGMTPTG